MVRPMKTLIDHEKYTYAKMRKNKFRVLVEPRYSKYFTEYVIGKPIGKAYYNKRFDI